MSHVMGVLRVINSLQDFERHSGHNNSNGAVIQLVAKIHVSGSFIKLCSVHLVLGPSTS